MVQIYWTSSQKFDSRQTIGCYIAVKQDINFYESALHPKVPLLTK